MRTGLFAAASLIAAAFLVVNSEASDSDRSRDEAGLWMRVDRIEQEWRTSNQIVPDEALGSHLKQLTCKTVGTICDELRIYVIRAPGFNAFMYPNGAMFVSSGLLLRVGDDAELAAVLGHETSHFTRKHALERIRRESRTRSGFAIANTLIAAAGTVATASSNSYQGEMAAQNLSNTAQAMLGAASVFATFQLVAYHRDEEREADLDGVNWMIARGIDPHGAPRIWQKVVTEQKAGGRESGFSILATHPAPQTRLDYLSEIAGADLDVSSQDIAPEDSRSHAENTISPLVDPHREDWIADEMESQHPAQFEVIARMQEGFGLSPGYTNYLVGKSWATHARSLRGSKEKHALEKAAAAFERAMAVEHGRPPEIFREWAKVNVAQGDTGAAAENYARYLSLVPDAWDAKYVRRQIKRLGQQ